MPTKTAQQIIERSARVLGVLGSGQSLNSDELDDGLDMLNGYLESLEEQQVTVPFRTTEQITLISGKNEYTWGSGGDINTDRPLRIHSTWLEDSSGTTYPFELIDVDEYANILLKGRSERPYRAWMEYSHPLGKLTLESKPDGTYTLYAVTLKPFTGFSTLSTSSDLPRAYYRLLVFNLALELAPEFEAPLRPDIIQAAERSLRNIKGANASRRVPVIQHEDALVIRHGGRWDIRRGY